MKKKSNELKVNTNLLKVIQPRGGITFKDETIVKSGDGYSSCLHIMEYPEEEYEHWLNRICNIQGTIATVDIGTDDVNDVKRNINKSMKEQNQRYIHAENYTDKSAAETRFMEMKQIAEELQNMNEVVKNIDVRVFFSDRSQAELERNIKDRRNELETSGFMGYNNLNETKADWTSFYTPYTQQQKELFAVEGQMVTSTQLAGGNPFHFSCLEDELGSFYGTTTVGGNVLFDLFYKSPARASYNAAVVGKMGSGKSTILKKMFEDRAIRGDYIRAFDVSGEFSLLAKTLGGKVLVLDGSSDKMFNMLEILRSGDNESTNYSRHIAKVKTMYRYFDPEVEEGTLDELGILLRELYERFNLAPEVFSNKKERRITGLPSEKYPILEDLVEQCKISIKNISETKYDEVQEKIAINTALKISSIQRKLESIIETYGSIFNGHTSLDNILNEQIIVFDISTIKEMDPNVFDAQFFNLASLSWDNAVANGKEMMRMDNEGEIEWEDITRTLILIDESHRTINATKYKALEQITTYMREARKYFASFVLASQSIRDYVPEGSSDLAINKLKTLFELTQYKFIFNHDENVLGLIQTVFGRILTEKQIAKIPQLETGNCYLCISSVGNLEFKVYITPEEKYVFNGGA